MADGTPARTISVIVSPTKPKQPADGELLLLRLGAIPGQNRMSYPREFKLTAIKYFYENGRNKYRTCKQFQITKSMLNGWLQKIDKIQQSRPGSLKSGRSGRKPQFPNVEKELFHVYQSHLDCGKKVGNRWLRETAKLIAQRTCHPSELNGMCQFSERWLCNFKKRYNINLSKDWSQAESSMSKSLISTTDAVDQSFSPATDADPQQTNLSMNNKEEVEFPQFVDSIDQPSLMSADAGKRGRKVQFPQVEKALNQMLCERQLDGVRVTNRWLQDEAKRLAIQLCPQTFHDAYKSARCMFSEHWLHNFKKRYGITLKHNVKQIANAVEPNSPQLPTVDWNDSEVKIDDLPTMVPLQNLNKHLFSVKVAEWYTQMQANGIYDWCHNQQQQQQQQHHFANITTMPTISNENLNSIVPQTL
ncbi:hypothetical protein T10_345 [Trichinella papuae]|uniref:HTH CENPB-type domain-containing protein n=1 Tax=Trichinella papuae TaxID=268474 RepID=A0A0V1MLR9_9BILA|nr:hypothetical protein T10_345 [Trichinella papuae]